MFRKVAQIEMALPTHAECSKPVKNKGSMTDGSAVNFRACVMNSLKVAKSIYKVHLTVVTAATVYGASLGFLRVYPKLIQRKPILAARVIAASSIKYSLGFIAMQAVGHGVLCSLHAAREAGHVSDKFCNVAAGSAMGFVCSLNTRSPTRIAFTTAGVGIFALVTHEREIPIKAIEKIFGPFT